MAQAGSSVDYAGTVDYLRALKTRGVSLGLDRMRGFLAALGDPQSSVPCIHIAGTNGKGSVAAMLESVLRSAGWRTGLYTSPHLVRLGERVQVDREILSEEMLGRHVRELRMVVDRLTAQFGADAHPSYFEFMTALAFRHFAQSGCDISVIEVGLGGRLDATNVVTPEVSIITSIGLDHCDVLGNTIAAIAAEKAGIIKVSRPVVIGRLPPDADRVIRSIAAANQAPVSSVADQFGSDVARYPETNLAGDYQRWNAATAALAARALPSKWQISDEIIQRGLMNVRWSGRWERHTVDGRLVIIDTTHNAEGAAVLDANLLRLAEETGRAPIIVAGVLGRSRAEPIIGIITRHAREIHLVVAAQSRACSIDQLQALIPSSFTGAIVPDQLDHIFPSATRCAIGEPGDTIVVTGSIYLAGEALARIEPTRGPSEGDLQDF